MNSFQRICRSPAFLVLALILCAADPYEFLDENFSISGILDNLDKLSPKELKCACCLFGTALQQARKKKKRKWYRR